jgi:hypothetical protein
VRFRLVFLLFVTSCTFDTSGIAPSADLRDRSQSIDLPWQPVTDATRADQARDRSDLMHSPEASPDDAPGVDRGSPPDTKPLPDATPAPDSPPPPSCDALFKGKVPGYSLCDETAASCRFYFSTSQANCSSLCGSQLCLTTEDNEPGTTCKPETNMACGTGPCTCSSNLGNGICTCQK